MKKAYQTPKARLVNYKYDEQVVASSVTACDQGWTRMTTMKPAMRSADCARCNDDMIWLNEKTW